jgi:hypothetical protein
MVIYFIYYESTKRKLKTKYICGCRCNERLQSKTKKFTRLSYTELDAIGAPSKLRVTRKEAAFASSSPHFDLS